jgi:hypothetical protein
VQPKALKAGEEQGAFEDRMQEVLRKVKTIRLPGNRKVVFKNVRVPAKTLSLSAEAMVNGEESGGDELQGKPVAFDAKADERDVRGLISIITIRPVFGSWANCMFDPPITPIFSTTLYE